MWGDEGVGGVVRYDLNHLRCAFNDYVVFLLDPGIPGIRSMGPRSHFIVLSNMISSCFHIKTNIHILCTGFSPVCVFKCVTKTFVSW